MGPESDAAAFSFSFYSFSSSAPIYKRSKAELQEKDKKERKNREWNFILTIHACGSKYLLVDHLTENEIGNANPPIL